MSGPLRISAAESQILEAIWATPEGAAGVEEIIGAVGEANSWGESTVRTLIHRLIGKGALKSERRRGAVVYSPLLSRSDYVTSESQGLLDRLFGGQLAPLVDHFTRERVVSPEDLARLKKLVADLDRNAADEEG